MQSSFRKIINRNLIKRKLLAKPTTFCHSSRFATMTIIEKMREIVPKEQDRIKQLVSKTKDEVLSKVTVQQAFQGMRSVKGLICETSELDVNEGIRFRGLTIPEIQEKLPTASCRGLPGEYPIPEAMLWLLLTGEIPSKEEAAQLSLELTSEPRISVPKHVRQLIDNLPVHMHPMAQFTSAILALQTESKFAKAYEEGVNKSKYWEYTLEDSLDLIAKIPYITSRIYRTCFRDGNYIPGNPKLDWSANWCHMSGHGGNSDDKTTTIYDLMRMYFTIHTDHEGGNVSAHATHLVGSALSDPYLSFAAGLCGLAGPLHGLANQESLRFILKIKRTFGDAQPTKEEIHKFVVQHLESGQVVPGFGHAVLRVTDPRYDIQRQFALKYMPNDEIFQIVSHLYEVVPEILKNWKGGKVGNPWPNVDAHSGCLLYHYGLKEEHFYTVFFGMSRAIGVLSQLVFDRYINYPIERPKSITTDYIQKTFLNKGSGN